MAKKSAARNTEETKQPRRSLALGNTAMSVLPAQFEAVPLAPGFGQTVNGLAISGSPSRERWEQAGEALRVVERAPQMALGDWFNYGQERYGDDIWQTIDAGSGWSLNTIRTYGWLAASIAPAIRRFDRLGIKHHLLVAALSPEKQREWLTKAAADDEEQPWTAARLAAALKAGEDLPPEQMWVLVSVNDIDDQQQLMTTLEHQGRNVKAVVRRGRARA